LQIFGLIGDKELELNIDKGVPQGTGLGSFLIYIMIND
jgi:homoserine kinase